MKRKRVAEKEEQKEEKKEEEEEEEEEEFDVKGFISASIAKGTTTLYSWKSAIEDIEADEALEWTRSVLANSLPGLFKGTPLESLTTNPGGVVVNGVTVTKGDDYRYDKTKCSVSFEIHLPCKNREKVK